MRYCAILLIKYALRLPSTHQRDSLHTAFDATRFMLRVLVWCVRKVK